MSEDRDQKQYTIDSSFEINHKKISISLEVVPSQASLLI
jgi:hypothetical protein